MQNANSKSRLYALLGFGAALVVVVAIVLVAGSGGGDSGSISTDLDTRPVIEASSGPPPSELQSKDIVEGDGAAAASGDQLSVQYVGADYSTGMEFDASWDRGEPFDFQLGSGSVIPGWDQGLVGMKVGGRRELIIPPAQAYGAQGQPPTIGPNATLTFVIDLLDVTPGGAAGAGAPGGGASGAGGADGGSAGSGAGQPGQSQGGSGSK